MNSANYQKNILKDAIYRLLIISALSYGLCGLFFNVFPLVTFAACLVLLLYFHKNPLIRSSKTLNWYTAITLLTFTPVTFMFIYNGWQGRLVFIESYPPISGMIIMTSMLIMLVLPKRHTKFGALFWALNVLPVLHYLLLHPAELHTSRGYDLLFLFGTASLFIVAIIPYQQNIKQQLDDIFYDLMRYKMHADRDFLTDIYNRRGLHSWLNRNNQTDTIGLVLLDVDYFKNINDRFGHATGDQVLVEIASRLRTVYRDNHCLVRWGGEEFLLVITNPSAATLNKLANDCHLVFGQVPFRTVGKVTTSIGVSRIASITAFDHVIEEADQALYHAKESGRDKIIAFSDIQQSLTMKMRQLLIVD